LCTGLQQQVGATAGFHVRRLCGAAECSLVALQVDNIVRHDRTEFICAGAIECAGPRAASDYLAAIEEPIAVPMISPEITISTRRFCCRPCAVSFEATGWDFPKPSVVTDAGAIPDCVR